jgi:sensor histidine kinase YesM
VINDRLLRAIGIPAFGISIPHLTGLFGDWGPRSVIFWLGSVWFVLLSFLIWHANRWLLFKQEQHVDWFGQPIQKIFLLLVGVTFGTVPVTVAMLVAWYRIADFPAIDWDLIREITLINVICVVFVTHVYETVFLINARADDRLEVERLSRSKTEAELETLKAQVDPHFLFNSLSTLHWLIEHDQAGACEFTQSLARVYRYILASRSRNLVLLAEEIGFLEDYLALIRLRFGDAVLIQRTGEDLPVDRRLVPPAALQVLVENAVKHNAFSRSTPLSIELSMKDDAVVLSNVRRPRDEPVHSPGVGLKNLAERCRLLTGRQLEISADAAIFSVRLPLLSV